MTRPLPPPTNHTEPAATEGNAGNLDLAQVRAAALLPEQLIQPGEIIILLLKPSPWYILLASLRALAIIAVAVILGLVLDGYGLLPISPRDLLVLAVGVAGVRLFWQFLQWLSRVYVLTDQRMIRVKGVVRVQVFECPLKQIQHTEAHYSLRERLFGLGTIGFATAGTALPEAHWVMIANPLHVHQSVVWALNRYR